MKKYNSRLTILSSLMLFSVLLFAVGCGKKDSLSVSKTPEPVDGSLIFPASDFSDGAARYYSYEDNGVKIRFFILKSSDGEIRAAFDSCDVCWRADKGYEQRGDSMICRNCGQSFKSDKINTVKGGCNPAPLERTSVDGKIIIRIDDLKMGKEFFDFSNRG